MTIYYKLELIYQCCDYKINLTEINEDAFKEYLKGVELDNIYNETENKSFIFVKVEQSDKLELNMLNPLSSMLILDAERKNARKRNKIICDAMQKLIDNTIVIFNMKMAKLNDLRLEIETKYKNKTA